MKTSFFLIFTIIIVSICCFLIFAQDYTQFSLPEGAIARIGKGSLGEVHFSPDGRWLAVSSSVGIWLYDPQTGKEIDLIVCTDSVYPFKFSYSPDGKTIATGSRDKTWSTTGPWGTSISPTRDFTVQLWNVTTGEEKTTLRGHIRHIQSIAYSPDGTTIVTAGGHEDNTVYLWDTATNKQKGTLERHTLSVNAATYSPDGNTIATASSDNTVQLWNALNGKHKATLTGHTKGVNAATYSPDGNTIATASSDNTIRLWDVSTGKHKATLRGHTDRVNAIIYSPDSNTIVSASSDSTARLWNANTGKHKATLTGHIDAVTSITHSPNGNTIATASGGRYSDDNTVRLWNARTGKSEAILTGHHRIDTVAYAADGKTFTCKQANSAQLWDVRTGQYISPRIYQVQNPSSTYPPIRGVSAYSPDGNTIAVEGLFNTIQVLNAKTGKRKITLKHTNFIGVIYMLLTDREYGINSIAFSPDGNTIVTGGGFYTHNQGTVYLWHVRTGKRKTVYKGHGYVSSVAFSPDGRTIAAGNWENKVQLWNVVTGEKLHTIPTEHRSGVESLAYSPDGKTLITSGGGYDDTKVHVLDVDTGDFKTTLIGRTGRITSIMYSPDGKTIATGSEDGMIQLWQADSGEHTATFTSHTEVASIICSPDGRTLASRNTDSTVLLWKIISVSETE